MLSFIVHALMVVAVIIIVVVMLTGFKIVQQYEKGVVVQLGRVVGLKEAGFKYVVPLFQKLIRINTRIQVLVLQAQQVITKDSVSVTIDAAIFFYVSDVMENYSTLNDSAAAIQQRGQGILRRIVGQHSLEDLLEHGEGVTQNLKQAFDTGTAGWGLVIDSIEIKDVGLPEGMRRAMASKAEASREADAKKTAAQGEKDSAELLRQAADMLDGTALELRRLQTIREIGTDNAAIIVTTFGDQGAAQSAAGTLAAQRVSASRGLQDPAPTE